MKIGSKIVMVYDLVDQETGKTIKQINLEKTHELPVGSLVELNSGSRLFVVKQTRDCDGSPLYSLSIDSLDTDQIRESMYNRSWSNGHHGDDLTLIGHF